MENKVNQYWEALCHTNQPAVQESTLDQWPLPASAGAVTAAPMSHHAARAWASAVGDTFVVPHTPYEHTLDLFQSCHASWTNTSHSYGLASCPCPCPYVPTHQRGPGAVRRHRSRSQMDPCVNSAFTTCWMGGLPGVILSA